MKQISAYVPRQTRKSHSGGRRFDPDQLHHFPRSLTSPPRIARIASELLYASGDMIIRVPIGGGASLNAGTPAPLFRIPGHHAAPRLTGSVSRPVIPSINVVLNRRKAVEGR